MTPALRALGAEPTPARPGPGPVPDALLKALELTIARRVDGLLSGDHRSALLGRGTELAQVRPYVPGDDVRLIDWNVTARTQEPHIRVHLAERVLVTWLVLDTSPSMTFGTAERRKADVALGVTLAVGHAATMRGNRVGLVGFGSGAERVLQPTQGRAGLVGLLLALREDDDGNGAAATSIPLATALNRLAGAARQRALVVIVSDFRGPRDWRRPLLRLAGRHEVVAVEIRDPREQELEPVGTLLARRPRVGTRAPGQHERREAPRAVRGRRPGGAAGGGARARERGRRPRDALDRPRLAARPRRLRQAEAPMTFEWPTALVLLLAIPLLVGVQVLGARRRRRQAARFSNPALVPNLVPSSPGLRRYVPIAIVLVALALLFVGVARPHVVRDVTRDEATVILTIDTSRSMQATDVEPNRFDAAKSAARAFLEEVPDSYAVGIVSFSTSADPVLPPTTDREAAETAINELRLGSGTALGQAIVRSAELAVAREDGESAPGDGERSPAAVLLLSDGAQTTGQVQVPAAAQRARELGVPVSTIGLGTGDAVVEVPRPGGLTERVVVAPDLPALRQIAQTTGGRFFEAPSAARLEEVYRELGTRLAVDRKRVEVTSAFAAGGAVLLLLGGALSSYWFRRAL